MAQLLRVHNYSFRGTEFSFQHPHLLVTLPPRDPTPLASAGIPHAHTYTPTWTYAYTSSEMTHRYMIYDVLIIDYWTYR